MTPTEQDRSDAEWMREMADQSKAGGRLRAIADRLDAARPTQAQAVIDAALRAALSWRDLPPLPWTSAADRQPWPDAALDPYKILDANGQPVLIRNWKEACAAIQVMVMAINSAHRAALADVARRPVAAESPSAGGSIPGGGQGAPEPTGLVERFAKLATAAMDWMLALDACEGDGEPQFANAREARSAADHYQDTIKVLREAVREVTKVRPPAPEPCGTCGGTTKVWENLGAVGMMVPCRACPPAAAPAPVITGISPALLKLAAQAVADKPRRDAEDIDEWAKRLAADLAAAPAPEPVVLRIAKAAASYCECEGDENGVDSICASCQPFVDVMGVHPRAYVSDLADVPPHPSGGPMPERSREVPNAVPGGTEALVAAIAKLPTIIPSILSDEDAWRRNSEYVARTDVFVVIDRLRAGGTDAAALRVTMLNMRQQREQYADQVHALRDALIEVRRVIEADEEAITDTIWQSESENVTLVDYIDGVLGEKED